MNMKYNTIILSLIALLFTWGCSDYLDVNHDPDAIEDIPDVKVLLPAVEVGIANNLMGWDVGFAGGFWVEYWTQKYTASQFKTLCDYQSENFNTAYTSLMREPMEDLKKMIDMTKDDGNKGYYFVAEALSIFTWQIMADLWGGLPYFEALQGDEGISHPKYDAGDAIYADLMTRIENLQKIDLSGSSIDGKYDFIYAGNLDKWTEFVNSLKLKLMLRVSETSGYDNASVLNYIESGVTFLSSSAKIPGSVWDENAEGKRHPMREFQLGGANYFSGNVIACKSFLDYLTTNYDPRADKLFTAPKGGHKGAFFGDYESKDDSDNNGTTDDKDNYSTSVFNLDAKDPAVTVYLDIMLMSAWEVNFYIAEVYARAGSSKAQDFYEAGVTASLSQHGIKDFTILETGYAQWMIGTQEEQIKRIAMQKWVANCNYQHVESFLERNRTKYPSVNEIDIAAGRKAAWSNFPVGDLTISVKGRGLLQGNLPASPLYPDAYITRNNNAPSQKPNIGQKVWWDKKAGK